MIRNPKVLIFSLVNFSKINGGVLCSVDMFEKLSTLPTVDFVLVTSAYGHAEPANREGAATLGLNNIFVPLQPHASIDRDSAPARIRAAVQDLLDIVLDKYYFFYERFYRTQCRHLEPKLQSLIQQEKPDLILIDGSWSALCVPSIFNAGPHCCLITHNHEVDIHNDFKLHVQGTTSAVPHRGVRFWFASRFNGISKMRFRRRIYRLYNRCTGIIALTQNDLPNDLPNHLHQAVFPPLLKESFHRWRHHGRRTLLFVGNVSYFANRLAVEWLCNDLSPLLLLLDTNIQINVIGASKTDIDLTHECQNVNFLGFCDKRVLIEHMTADSLFIAPTSQTYGAKLKLAECASHGMPFLATETAMAGLPFLTFVPRISLEDPSTAANLIIKYLDDVELLNRLSRDVLEGMAQARTKQAVALSAFMRKLLAHPRPHGAVRTEESGFRAAPHR